MRPCELSPKKLSRPLAPNSVYKYALVKFVITALHINGVAMVRFHESVEDHQYQLASCEGYISCPHFGIRIVLRNYFYGGHHGGQGQKIENWLVQYNTGVFRGNYCLATDIT
jgi:hypothetical protein